MANDKTLAQMKAELGKQSFKDWFKESHAADESGAAKRLYRGEHGPTKSGELQSKLGSYTFVDDPKVASTYAESPNDLRMTATQSRVIPAYLQIRNPIIKNLDDPFVDLSEISQKLGLKQAIRFARKHADHIESTNNWDENFSRKYDSVHDLLDKNPQAVKDLYLDAYRLLDDKDFVREAKRAGYDGAIHMGNGESMDALEYRVFNKEQVKPSLSTDITKAGGGSVKTVDQMRTELAAGGKAKQTDTPEFKKWFGDSKVVDESGEPLVVYRGVVGGGKGPTAESLNAEPRAGYASFGSDSPHVASSYANPDEGESGAVTPLHIKAHKLIEFPVTVNKNGSRSFDKFEFDRHAKSLRPGEVLVARKVYDIGPRASLKTDPEKRYSYPSDIYAWGPGTSVKSAIGNRGTYDPSDPDITKAEGGEVKSVSQMKAELAKSPFYSAVDRGIEALPQNAGTGQQMLAMLQKQPEVKKAELQERGLHEIAQQPKITKEQLRQLAIENAAPSVKAVSLPNEEDHTKYGQYVLPGGQNYGETLLHLESAAAPIMRRVEAYGQTLKEKYGENKWLTDASPEEKAQYSALLHKAKESPGIRFMESHWAGYNDIMAHFRHTDRQDAEGKKTLFIEELQSDWAQAGKKEGFTSKEKFAQKKQLEQSLAQYRGLGVQMERSLRDANSFPEGDPRAARFFAEADSLQSKRDELIKAISKLEDATEGEPPIASAPFVGNTSDWVTHTLKHIVHKAVHEGYDKVAFVNAQQQHERFPQTEEGKSTRVPFSAFYGEPDGTVIDNEGDVQEGKKPVLHAALQKLIPKLGGRLTTVDVGQSDPLETEKKHQVWKDYDPTVAMRDPSAVKYKVVTTFRGRETHHPEKYNTWEEAAAVANRMRESEPQGQIGFEITPEMRERVTKQGLPLYAAGGNVQEKPMPTLAEMKMALAHKADGGSMAINPFALDPTFLAGLRARFSGQAQNPIDLAAKVAQANPTIPPIGQAAPQYALQVLPKPKAGGTMGPFSPNQFNAVLNDPKYADLWKYGGVDRPSKYTWDTLKTPTTTAPGWAGVAEKLRASPMGPYLNPSILGNLPSTPSINSPDALRAQYEQMLKDPLTSSMIGYNKYYTDGRTAPKIGAPVVGSTHFGGEYDIGDPFNLESGHTHQADQKKFSTTPGAALLDMGIDPNNPYAEQLLKARMDKFMKENPDNIITKAMNTEKFGREGEESFGYKYWDKKYPDAPYMAKVDAAIRGVYGQNALEPRSFNFIDPLVEAFLSTVGNVIAPGVGTLAATAYGGIKGGVEGGVPGLLMGGLGGYNMGVNPTVGLINTGASAINPDLGTALSLGTGLVNASGGFSKLAGDIANRGVMAGLENAGSRLFSKVGNAFFNPGQTVANYLKNQFTTPAGLLRTGMRAYRLSDYFATQDAYEKWLEAQRRRTGRSATGGSIKMADGGPVNEPSLAEMRAELAKRSNLSEVRKVGINEAPDMEPKLYMSPDRRTSEVAVGGADLDGMQPGQQLMPQPPQPSMQPQPQEQAQGQMPQQEQMQPTPPPQPQGNMLNLTPQGQMMNAMQPPAQQQSPPQMARGGKVGFAIQPPAERAKAPGEFTPYDPDNPSIKGLATAFDEAIRHHLSLSPEERRQNSAQATERVGQVIGKTGAGKVRDLLGKNAKLMKSEKGKEEEAIKLPDGRGVETTGLALAPAFSQGKFTTCPNSASCKEECLGKTSGNYFKVGGGKDLTAFKGPRLNSLLKTLAFLKDPHSFAVKLHDEIDDAKAMAAQNGNHLGVRLNVLSDINPRVHKSIMEAHPDVTFYDYTKNNSDPIASNHHYTYSSTGVSQPGVENKNSNWKSMRRRLDEGDNVAMAFSHKEHLPEFVHDQETGKKYRVVDGDTHDFRPLDMQPEGEPGVIVGLKNKKAIGKVEDAHIDSHGFFVYYDPMLKKNPNGTYEREASNRISPTTGRPMLGDTIPQNRVVNIQPQGHKMIPISNDEGDKA